MICLDCSHVITRKMVTLYGEVFFFCDIDGLPVITPIVECNRFEGMLKQGIQEDQPPENVFKWNKKRK